MTKLWNRFCDWIFGPHPGICNIDGPGTATHGTEISSVMQKVAEQTATQTTTRRGEATIEVQVRETAMIRTGLACHYEQSKRELADYVSSLRRPNPSTIKATAQLLDDIEQLDAELAMRIANAMDAYDNAADCSS